MNFSWAIRAQVLLLVTAVATPLVALFAYNVSGDFVEARAAAVAGAMRLTEITVAETSRFLGDSRELLLGLSRRPLVNALDAQRCDPLFGEFLDLHPRFALVFTVDTAGTPVCASAATPRADPLARRYDLRDLRRSGQFSIGKPILGPLTGKWVVVLFQPLRDAAGSLRGAVALSVDLANFHPLAGSVALPPQTSIRIIDAEGTVIASLRDAAATVGKETRGAAIVDAVLARKQGDMRAAGMDGIERVYGFAPVPATDWYAYAGVPVSAAFAEAYRSALRNAAVGLLLVLLALALAAVYARRIVAPVRAMARTAQDVAQGDSGARFRVEGAAEIAEVAVQFNRALDSLREDEHLLQLLSRRLFETEESERRRLARELHDRIGSNVTALALNLNLVRGALPADSLQKVESSLADCKTLLDSTARLVRDVMADLRPPGLDELGLLAALTEHARQVASRSGISVSVAGAETAPRLSPATEITLFRIAQEALVNVAKHSGATRAAVSFESGPDAALLSVADDGRGFDPAARQSRVTPSLGIVSMRERAESLGGRLRVESAPGKGTRVIVEVPRG